MSPIVSLFIPLLTLRVGNQNYFYDENQVSSQVPFEKPFQHDFVSMNSLEKLLRMKILVAWPSAKIIFTFYDLAFYNAV